VLRLNVTGKVLHTQAITNGVGGLPSGTNSANDFFGISLSTDGGDIDSDGLNDLLVSASGSDAAGTDRGALYVLFMQADDTVRTFTRISQATGEGLDNSPLAHSFLGDGLAAIPPRSPGNPIDVAISTTQVVNAVVLFRLASNGTVIGIPEVIADGREGVTSLPTNELFGQQVYPLGDLDGDGEADISVGNALDSESGANSGAVYILFLNPGNSTDAVKSLLKITPATSGLSGVAPTGNSLMVLAPVGDLDGDGRREVAFGFGTDDHVIVARLGGLSPSVSPTPSVSPSASLTPSPSPSPAGVGTVFDAVIVGNNQGGLPSGVIAAGDTFGRYIAGIGDINGDGIPDIAAGAELDDDVSSNTGAVYIIFMNSDRTAKGYQKISATEGGASMDQSTSLHFGYSPQRMD